MKYILLLFAIITPTCGAEDLYKIGQDAFNKKNYVTSLKYLFAFKIKNEKKLQENIELKNEIERAISISEMELHIKCIPEKSPQIKAESVKEKINITAKNK